MKLRGRLHDITKVLEKDGVHLRLQLDVKEIPSGVDKLPEGDLSLTLEPFHGKRSMTANAYYWVLVGKMAKQMRVPQSYVHNMLLREYGVLELIGGQNVIMTIPDSRDADEKVLTSDLYHLRPTSRFHRSDSGDWFRDYLVIRGSSTYDSAEMAALIDGAVSEAKDLGIETLPPEELERMLGGAK